MTARCWTNNGVQWKAWRDTDTDTVHIAMAMERETVRQDSNCSRMQQNNGVVNYGMGNDRGGDVVGGVKNMKTRDVRGVKHNGWIGPRSSRLHDV